MKKAVLFALMCLMNFGLVSHANAAKYFDPKWNGYALDWCKNFEQGCGEPAADLFCQRHGSPKANSYQIWPLVNFPTMTVGQNAICNPADHRCDSFKFIDCQETTKTFVQPKYKGYRLDWCREFENDCGAPAAQEYCQLNGFSQVVNFQRQGPLTVQTMVEGSNAICNPQYHGCDGFLFIQCKK